MQRKSISHRSYRPKHRLGQHFLVDETVLQTIASTAHLAPSGRVLEIGPGLGILTEALSHEVSDGLVLAVEKDHDLVYRLRERFRNRDNVKIIAGDILIVPLTDLLQPPYHVVANVPYGITSPIITKFLLGDYRHRSGEMVPRPETLTLLIQREVAERLVAPAGSADRGILTVLIELFGTARYIETVPPSAFEPPPQVESAILHIELGAPAIDPSAFHWLLKVGFANRRRQFHNALAGSLRITPAAAEELLASVGIGAQRRAEQLTLDEWLAVFDAVKTTYLPKANRS